MSDVSTIPSMDDFKELQQRLNHESIRYQFRSKLIGGLNQDDVTEYIESIEEKLHKLEQENNSGLEDIYSLRERLNKEIKEKKNLQESLDEVQHNLESCIAERKSDELIIQSLNENGNSEIAKMQNEIHKMTEEREELKKLLFESNNSIEQIREYAVGLEEDNNDLKLKIMNLEIENSEIPQLQNKIHQITEERIEIEKLLSESILENEQIKKCAAAYEEENIVMKSKIEDLEKENYEIDELQNKILQMAEERKEIDKLLAESDLAIERLNEYSSKLEEEINVMKSKIMDLEDEISSDDIQSDEIYRVCHELENELKLEKSCNEKQRIDIEMFSQKIISLEEKIAVNLIEIEEQRKISENAEQELMLEKAQYSSYKINGFKDEFSGIYKKIENLANEVDQHVKTNNELKQLLTAEQLRANKAENDLSTFIKSVSTLKDKLYSEQNLLEVQFKQIVDKRNQFQVDFNDCLMNLQ